MTHSLQFKGNPRLIRWTLRISHKCSYCGAAIPEDSGPLRLFAPDGRGAVFCDACSTKCFGMKRFDEPTEDKPE